MAESFLQLYREPLPESPCWISGGVLPKGGILMLGGPAKIGKTFVLLDMADALTNGESWWESFEVKEKACVLYLEQEIGPYELQRRAKMRYDGLKKQPSERMYYISKQPGLFLDTEDGVKKISKEIQEVKANVLLVDPISRCMIGDENSNTDVQTLIRRLDELTVRHKDLSIVLSHHFGKPPRMDDGEYDPLSPYNFRGASKWFDAPDMLVTFQRIAAGRENEWWRLNYRFEPRQAPKPPDGTLVIGVGGLITKPKIEIPKGLPKATGGWK